VQSFTQQGKLPALTCFVLLPLAFAAFRSFRMFSLFVGDHVDAAAKKGTDHDDPAAKKEN
jgi:hypothetical protein